MDCDGSVTVTVVKADGSTLSSGTATGHPGVGTYTVSLAAQAELDSLTVTGTGTVAGSPVASSSTVDIVGGHLFPLAKLRAMVTSTEKYPDADLLDARLQVETEFEDICGRAFVPRFNRETFTGDGGNLLVLGKPEAHAVKTLTVDGVDRLSWVTDGTLRPTDDAFMFTLFRQTWPRASLIVIEYEYGLTQVPPRVRRAALKRARGQLLGDTGRIDERATMQVTQEGTFTLATAGRAGSLVGVPDIDVVLYDSMLARRGAR
jgi:hypothetical protein